MAADAPFITTGVASRAGELESGQLVAEFESWGVLTFDTRRLSLVFLVGHLLLCLAPNSRQSPLRGCSVSSAWSVPFIARRAHEAVKKSTRD